MKSKFEGSCKVCKTVLKIGDEITKVPEQNGIFEHWCSNPNCPNEAPKQQQQQLKSSGKSLEEQLARTKAFIEMMKASDVPVEAWPACAGVFNKS